MKVISITIRATLALLISFLLFVSLPIIYRLLGSDLLNAESRIKSSPVLMKVETQKPEKKKVQQLKPRQIKSSRGKKPSRSHSLKFTPDLKVGSSEGVAVEERNLESVVFEEGEADVNAIPISRTPVPYPRRAKEAGIEGKVDMILLIDRKGRVESITFTQVPHAMFKKPIEKVVKKWKFSPAMNKGVPVKMRVRQPLEFSLEK